MKLRQLVVAGLTTTVAVIAIGGCSSSSNTDVIVTPPPPVVVDNTFKTFVYNVLASTNDASDPYEINTRTFIFDEDPTDFIPIFGAPGPQ